MTPEQTSSPNIEALNLWRDLKFGMFIHFGLYAIPAGEWKGRKCNTLAEWIQHALQIPHAEYRELVDQFNPVNWDPEFIAQLAVDAGMKYLVITSKHHDGFCLFDSAVSDYDIMSTPYGKDLIAELAVACRKHGVKLGLYYSHAQDWEDPDAAGNSVDFDPEQQDFQRYLDRKCKPQLREILTHYGDLITVWCDTPRVINKAQSQEVLDLIHELQPNCLVCTRVGNGLGDYTSLGDNVFPGAVQNTYAETAGTMNDTWGFKNVDQDWKSARELAWYLSETAFKGVNYLLNIGPKGDGTVPQQSVDILHELGTWTHRNARAIYAVQPSPYSYNFSWGGVTRRDNSLYVFVTDDTVDTLALPGVLSQAESATLLGDNQPITMRQDNDVVTLSFTPSPDMLIPVIELHFTEPPQVDGALRQLPGGDISLQAHLATTTAQAPVIPANIDALPEDIRVQLLEQSKTSRLTCCSGGWMHCWHAVENFISWTFPVTQPGAFDVYVSTVSQKYQPWGGQHTVRVECGSASCEAPLTNPSPSRTTRAKYFKENVCKVGTIALDHTGDHTLTLRALEIDQTRTEGLAVTEVRLVKL